MQRQRWHILKKNQAGWHLLTIINKNRIFVKQQKYPKFRFPFQGFILLLFLMCVPPEHTFFTCSCKNNKGCAIIGDWTTYVFKADSILLYYVWKWFFFKHIFILLLTIFNSYLLLLELLLDLLCCSGQLQL